MQQAHLRQRLYAFCITTSSFNILGLKLLMFCQLPILASSSMTFDWISLFSLNFLTTLIRILMLLHASQDLWMDVHKEVKNRDAWEQRTSFLEQKASSVAFVISQVRQRMLLTMDPGASQERDAKQTQTKPEQVICQHPLQDACSVRTMGVIHSNRQPIYRSISQ